MAALDAQANDLLAKLDTLGTVDPSGEPDCAKLQELTAASLELQATVKAKAAYTLAKLDQMMGGAPGRASRSPEPNRRAARGQEPPSRPRRRRRRADLPSSWRCAKPHEPRRPDDAAPRVSRRARWRSRAAAIRRAPPDHQSVPPLAPEEEGYTIQEIMAASEGLFGKVSANLAAVIEHLFSKSGRPTGYVLGTEGGGAFLAGVRYGKGTLYMRSGGTQKIYWHGPSIGTDVGAEGSKTLFLIYRLQTPEELYAGFTGIDGSAYLVGGVGATLVTNGRVIMAPIRSGIGLRLGANIGYIRFTPNATWNPF